MSSNPVCPQCKSELEQKTGQGNFNIWRCTSFPKCKYFTRKLGKENVSMYSIPEPDYLESNLGSNLGKSRRSEVLKKAKKEFLTAVFKVACVLAYGAFAYWAVIEVMGWLGNRMVENVTNQQAKMQVDMTRAKRESEARNVEYTAHPQQAYTSQPISQSTPEKPTVEKHRLGSVCNDKKCTYQVEIIERVCNSGLCYDKKHKEVETVEK